MSGYREIDGVDQLILDTMVIHGHARKEDDYYVLTEEGENWLRDWCADQFVKLGAELQVPLPGMDGTWVATVDGEEMRAG